MRVKKYIAALCIILAATTTTAAASERQMVAPWHFKGRYYAMLCKVTRVTYNHNRGCDRVRLRNANGQVYVCWTDKGDYDRGDYVAVIMDTVGTQNVLDDAVVAIKYERPDLI